MFDVEDAGELDYVVLEWVAGESLLGMLADGPLDALNAVSLLSEAARAIAAAHAGGLAHLRLNPACLHWTRGSGVKITGLGINAVLAGSAPGEDGPTGESPELTDTRDLARLLYAALTGYWPGPLEPAEPVGPEDAAEPGGPQDRTRPTGPTGLPLAPEADGVPCRSAPGIRGGPGHHRRPDLPGAVPAAQPSRPGAEHPGDAGRGPGQRGPARPAAGARRGHGVVPPPGGRRRPADRARQPVPRGRPGRAASRRSALSPARPPTAPRRGRRSSAP